MRIIGVAIPGGAELFNTVLAHGEDPHHVVSQHGLTFTRPLSATLEDGQIVLTVQVAPTPVSGCPPRRPPNVDGGLRVVPGEELQVHQRIAAYALVLTDRGLLATEFSDRTHVPGHWGLPGGGVDPGETPAETIVRELWEETGQHVTTAELLDVQSDHWVGRSPRGTLEDFHAVRLLYRAQCADPTEPVVHDTGGTTADARWWPTNRWRQVAWTGSFQALLHRHLPAVLAAAEH